MRDSWPGFRTLAIGLRSSRRSIRAYAIALLAIVATTTALYPFRPDLNALNIALVYLIVVSALSLIASTGPSGVASVFAFLCFDYFFIPPYYTLSVARSDHFLALFVFLGAAVLVTQLTGRAHAHTEEALRHGRQTATLYDLSAALIGEIGLDATLAAVVRRVWNVFALDGCAILLDEHGELVGRAVEGNILISLTDPNLLGLGRWVATHHQIASLGATRAKLRPPGPPGQQASWNFALGLRDRDVLLLPIATTRRSIGVLVASRRRNRPRFDEEESRLLATFANQAALAIERCLLTDEQVNAEVLARSDELKSALLSAVSHDLRTPLASIKASATSLLQPDVTWSDEDRKELLEAIDEEADRLNRFVANLLDLTRIEAGALQPSFEWYDLREIIHDAVNRSEQALSGHPLQLDLPEDVPANKVDYIEIAQVLINLLENAVKYSPAGSPVSISFRVRAHEAEIAVRDHGVGLPAGEETRIFDRFYRVEARNRPIGSGIGLAIARGFIEAHGGKIWAERNPEGGITVRFTLPLAERVLVTTNSAIFDGATD
jgi:two-component system sensor histidine kinase KdpD